MNNPPEPTGDECNSGARVADYQGCPAYACWYPQMGGYCSKCVIVFEPEKETYDYCFDAFVWHDGEFPFTESEPRQLHHCVPSQFVCFGNFVQEKQKECNAR